MSLAGVRSSRGDYYQILIATHWMIRLLREPQHIKSVAVEVVALPGDPTAVLVDDVVIEFTDGHQRFVQAKKNQPEFRPWSIAELTDELQKACGQLHKFPGGEIEFVSRNEFSPLRKLREATEAFPGYEAFKAQVPAGVADTLHDLAARTGQTSEFAFHLARQLRFGSTQDFDSWEAENRFNIKQVIPLASTALAIFESLTIRSTAKVQGAKTVFTRDDLLAALAQAGLAPTPYRSEAEILQGFAEASAVGRQWQRDVGGHRIPRPYLETVLAAIKSGKRTVLVQGGPGSGKTCILLDVADAIESRSDLGLLFIKAERVVTENEDEPLGVLPRDLVGLCARLSEFRQVIVIIDSLDVLSLSRHHKALNSFLSVVDKLGRLEHVCTIIACREFDLKYDPLLRSRQWEQTVKVGPLDFNSEVIPLLRDLGVDTADIAEGTRGLIIIPNLLRLYITLVERGRVVNASTPYELFELFTDELILSDKEIGQAGMDALSQMAEELLLRRSSGIPRVRFVAPQAIKPLLSVGVLTATTEMRLEFGHQTWTELLAVRKALFRGESLSDFIKKHKPLPFIRPTVRAFFFCLRAYDSEVFRREIRAVIVDVEIPYHLKRLVAESLAELKPTADDWGLVRNLSDDQPDLFRRFFSRAVSADWFTFLRERWLPHALGRDDSDEIRLMFLWRVSTWMNTFPVEAVQLWQQALRENWGDARRMRWQIATALDDFKKWSTPGIRELLEKLLETHVADDREFLGKPISLFVQSTNTGDDLLWKWVTSDFKGPTRFGGRLREGLHCAPHELCSQSFLQDRMLASSELLDMALNSILKWGEEIASIYGNRRPFFNGLLDRTSWEREHSDLSAHLASGMELLMAVVEHVLCEHAKSNSKWWQEHANSLRNSPELALRYFHIKCCIQNVGVNTNGIREILTDGTLIENRELSYELGQLMNVSYPYLSADVRLENQQLLLQLYQRPTDAREKYWIGERLASFIEWIPACFRMPQLDALLETYRTPLFPINRKPDTYISTGWVRAPFDAQQILSLTDNGIVKILKHYDSHPADDIQMGRLVGGKEEVLRELHNAAALVPCRFSQLLTRLYSELYDLSSLLAVIGGLATHLRYRSGRLSKPQNWEPKSSPQPLVLAREMFDWLDRLPRPLRTNYHALEAALACADAFSDVDNAERLTLWLFVVLHDGDADGDRDQEDRELIQEAINSVQGRVAEAAMILCGRLIGAGLRVPDLLVGLLKACAIVRDTSVRALVLYYLPYIMAKTPELGWALFRHALIEPNPRLWAYTERPLYSQYHDHYERTAPWLARLAEEAPDDSSGGWGRLVTLACVSGHIGWDELIKKLERKQSVNAWKGSAEVFVANMGHRASTVLCYKGLMFLLSNTELRNHVMDTLEHIFLDDANHPYITHEFARAYLDALEKIGQRYNLHGFLGWLAYAARENPRETLEAAERMVQMLERGKEARQLWDRDSLLPALTSILREADQLDDDKFIRRAIAVQDALLRLDAHGIEELYDSAAQA